MKILNRKHLAEMEDDERDKYVEELNAILEKKGWYEKSEAGELSEKDQKLFDRIMQDFRWLRMYLD